MDGFSKNKKFDKVEEMFYSMVKGVNGRPKPNDFSCGVMMSALLLQGKVNEANQLLLDMEDKMNLKPDETAFSSVIDGLWKGFVDKALELFQSMEKGTKNRPKPDVITYASIIDMYSKNGHVSKAIYLFISLNGNPNDIINGTMMELYGAYGMVDDGVRFFHQQKSVNKDIQFYDSAIKVLAVHGDLNLLHEYFEAIRLHRVDCTKKMYISSLDCLGHHIRKLHSNDHNINLEEAQQKLLKSLELANSSFRMSDDDKKDIFHGYMHMLKNRLEMPKYIIESPTIDVVDTNLLLKPNEEFFTYLSKSTASVVAFTGLQELPDSNFELYVKILKEITKEGNLTVFPNEFIQETYIGSRQEKSPGVFESHNDRNDRAIRTATSYFKKKFPTKRVVLCTNDKKSGELARKEGLQVASFWKDFKNN